MVPIISSKYDTDGYKLTMGYIFYQLNMVQDRKIMGRYEFYDRDNRIFPSGFADRLRDEVIANSNLSPEPDIPDFVMKKWPFMNREFLRWYDQVFYHDPTQVDIAQQYGKLMVTVEGPIHTATHHEIPILRDISCLLTEYSGAQPKPGWEDEAEANAKLFWERNVAHSEFGGRRPRSIDVHKRSLERYAKYPKTEGKGGLLGTSWVKYAYDLGLMIMGTMAHEYIQLMAAVFGYEKANLMAMEMWVNFYGRRLGYYLPDTFTTDVALRDFNYFYASTFGGTRQDSGDEIEYVEKLLKHYESLGIDPRTKAIIFSNSLKTKERILELNDYKPGKFIRSFGLGGFITNNVGLKPYNMVLKLTGVKIGDGDWIDVVKLSDDPGKAIGYPLEVGHCKSVLGID